MPPIYTLNNICQVHNPLNLLRSARGLDTQDNFVQPVRQAAPFNLEDYALGQMLSNGEQNSRQGGNWKVIAKGELADGYGNWYVREVTTHHKLKASKILIRMQNDVISGLLCEFKHDLALLPSMHSLCYYNLNVETIIYKRASACVKHVFARGCVAVWESERWDLLFGHLVLRLSTWILPKRVLVLARRYLTRFKA